MHITFLTENLSSNSLGRTYCLWLLAEQLGWTSDVLSIEGKQVWEPLQDSPFARSCMRVERSSLADAIAPQTDLIIACKPLPGSLGEAIPVGRARGLPILVDIDDPDLEMRLRVGNPLTASARALRRPRRTIQDLRLRRASIRLPSVASNPWLARRYGGTVIPHVRPDLGSGAKHEASSPQVAFVGTSHKHKGLQTLRIAVARARPLGYRLTVTAEAPADAAPWESWVGTTSLEDGQRIVADADVVIVPSLKKRGAVGQLPAKLIDAMMLGRAVAVSDIDPLPWAIGEGGRVFRAGSAEDISDVLKDFAHPEVRAELGRRARARALAEYSVESNAPRFAAACDEAMADYRVGGAG